MRRGTTSSNRHRTAAWLAVLALVAAFPIAAQTTPPHSEETSVKTDASPSEAAPLTGLRAFVDPETGELTSTPTRQQIEQLERLIAQRALIDAETPLSRSSAGLETFALANGGRGVHLQGRFQSALVVRRTDHGELELTCRDDASETPHEHRAGAPAPAVPTEWAEQ